MSTQVVKWTEDRVQGERGVAGGGEGAGQEGEAAILLLQSMVLQLHVAVERSRSLSRSRRMLNGTHLAARGVHGQCVGGTSPASSAQRARGLAAGSCILRTTSNSGFRC